MRYSKNFVSYIFLSAFFYLGLSLWQTLFSLFLDYRGFTINEIGVAGTLIFSLRFLLSFFAGIIIDRVNLKINIFLANILSFSYIVLLNYVSGFYLLVLICFIAGFASSLYVQLSVKIISFLSKVRERGTIFSIYFFSTDIAYMIGSALSGSIVQNYGYIFLNQVSGMIFLLTSIFSLILFPDIGIKPDHSTLPSFKNLVKNRIVILLTLSLILHDSSIFISTSYMPLLAKHVLLLSETAIGFLAAVKRFSKLSFQIISGKSIDKFGGKIALILHFILTSIGYIGYGLSRNFTDMMLANIFLGFSITLDLPARRLLLSSSVPKEYVATISGISDTLVGLFIIPSPIIGGYIWNNIDPRLVFIVAGIANLSSLVPIFFMSEKR